MQNQLVQSCQHHTWQSLHQWHLAQTTSKQICIHTHTHTQTHTHKHTHTNTQYWNYVKTKSVLGIYYIRVILTL